MDVGALCPRLRLVIGPRVRRGFAMAIQRWCSDRWRRFRSAGTRSRLLQPVTRHRCEGTPRRVAASKSGDPSTDGPHSERQALHPRPLAVVSRFSAAEEGQRRPSLLPIACNYKKSYIGNEMEMKYEWDESMRKGNRREQKIYQKRLGAN